jgi:methylmalonyl-CoA epimerase
MSIIKRLDHVAIGVEDKEAAIHFIKDILGATPLEDRGSSDAAAFTWDTFNLGGKKIEIVSPHVHGEGGIGKYLAKKGEGLHHMTLAVENLDEAMKYFESHNIRILSVDRSSANFQHFFLHPKDTFGASIQIFEENEEAIRLAE